MYPDRRGASAARRRLHTCGVRVVAGTCRGRKIAAPPGGETRPTSDRVREAIFNALGSLDAVEDARVADLFAGSGALGIEALSRGAARCTFVERHRGAASVIEENLRTLQLTDRSDVAVRDVMTHLTDDAPRFDLALIDPPYRFDRWDELLVALDAGVIVIESDRVIEMPPQWLTVREKQYGGTVVLIARRVPGQAQG